MYINIISSLMHATLEMYAERSKGVEFYNFLQINTDSNRSEVIDYARKEKQGDGGDEEEEEVDQKAASPPFIDFLSVGSSS